MSESDTPKSRFDTKSLVVPALPIAPRPTFFTPSNMSCFQALFTSPCTIKYKLLIFLLEQKYFPVGKVLYSLSNNKILFFFINISQLIQCFIVRSIKKCFLSFHVISSQ